MQSLKYIKIMNDKYLHMNYLLPSVCSSTHFGGMHNGNVRGAYVYEKDIERRLYLKKRSCVCKTA